MEECDVQLLKLGKLCKGSLDLPKWVTSRVDRDFRIDPDVIASCQEALRGSREKRKQKGKKKSASKKKKMSAQASLLLLWHGTVLLNDFFMYVTFWGKTGVLTTPMKTMFVVLFTMLWISRQISTSVPTMREFCAVSLLVQRVEATSPSCRLYVSRSVSSTGTLSGHLVRKYNVIKIAFAVG